MPPEHGSSCTFPTTINIYKPPKPSQMEGCLEQNILNLFKMKENLINPTNQKLPLRGGLEGLSCIIVEDEELPRLSLKSKLETYHPDMHILDMYDNAEDAAEGILRFKPQILFLDIQLPGKNSLWLLEQLQTAMKLPQIIFTTAYTDSEYMLKAIRFSAVDYLNKPVNIVELAHAVEKAKVRILTELGSQAAHRKNSYSFRVLNAQLIVSDDEIVYVKADGNYSKLQHVHGKEEFIFERLGDIEKKLDPSAFIRAGRSLLINKNFVHKLNAKDCSCTLTTPTQSFNVEISKPCFEFLRDFFTMN